MAYAAALFADSCLRGLNGALGAPGSELAYRANLGRVMKPGATLQHGGRWYSASRRCA